ncbi:hypothetical protein VTI28DRAFT_4243 [Corynascus sepedonium]
MRVWLAASGAPAKAGKKIIWGLAQCFPTCALSKSHLPLNPERKGERGGERGTSARSLTRGRFFFSREPRVEGWQWERPGRWGFLGPAQRTATWVDLPDVEVALAKRVRSPFRHREEAPGTAAHGTGSKAGWVRCFLAMCWNDFQMFFEPGVASYFLCTVTALQSHNSTFLERYGSTEYGYEVPYCTLRNCPCYAPDHILQHLFTAFSRNLREMLEHQQLMYCRNPCR